MSTRRSCGGEVRSEGDRRRAHVARALFGSLLIGLALIVTACGGSDAEGDSGEAGGGGGEDLVIAGAWPLSGAFSFNGNALLDGAKAAVEDINEAGGIESLDGRKLRLVPVDVGDTPEKTASAIDRFLSENPEAVAISGSWLSSLTLAGTEVAERQGVPTVTDSFADAVTDREGFSHIFAYATAGSEIQGLMTESTVPMMEEAGIDLKSVGVVGDNTAAATPLQEGLVADLTERGIEVGLKEQWTPPLQDASVIAQQVANADVDALYLIAFSFNDVSSLVRQLAARGVDIPIIQYGGQALLPEWRELGDDVLNLAGFVLTNPLSKSKELTDQLAQRLDKPYVMQDDITGYFAMQIIADAIERAGSDDPEAVTEALATSSFSGDAVQLMPTDELRFDDSGRITPPVGVLTQWQEVDGELIPCTVWPAEYAVCESGW